MTTQPELLKNADPLLPFAHRYQAIFGAYLAHDREALLIEISEWARAALANGLGLGDVCSLHFAAVQTTCGRSAISGEARQRTDQILREIMSVYDLAGRGYDGAVQPLRTETAERRQIEDKLRETSAELKDQRDQLDAKVLLRTKELAHKAHDLERALLTQTQINREQAEFTYAVSHDLKSPNNTIRMLIDELALSIGPALTPDSAELLELARQTTGRMGRLVDDVLAYSRCIENQPAMVPVDLGSLVGEIIADLRSDIATAGAIVDVSALPVVWGVPVQMKLLFQNLIANSVKFRAPGRTPFIQITQNPQGKTVLISVRDNGIGIAPDHHARVFGLFQRLHDHGSYQGSGLGLALCKRIMVNHAGDIRVKSRPGEGSCFTVSLKRHP